MSSVWFSAMILLLSRLKKIAGSARFTKWLKTLTGIVFIGFGTKLLFLKV